MREITVTRTETYTPVWVRVSFAKYDDSFRKIRDGMRYTASSCFRCSTKFQVGENIGIACFKEVGNKVLCRSCAEWISQEN